MKSKGEPKGKRGRLWMTNSIYMANEAFCLAAGECCLGLLPDSPRD